MLDSDDEWRSGIEVEVETVHICHQNIPGKSAAMSSSPTSMIYEAVSNLLMIICVELGDALADCLMVKSYFSLLLGLQLTMPLASVGTNDV